MTSLDSQKKFVSDLNVWNTHELATTLPCRITKRLHAKDALT
jgi:hypothetical protein